MFTAFFSLLPVLQYSPLLAPPISQPRISHQPTSSVRAKRAWPPFPLTSNSLSETPRRKNVRISPGSPRALEARDEGLVRMPLAPTSNHLPPLLPRSPPSSSHSPEARCKLTDKAGTPSTPPSSKTTPRTPPTRARPGSPTPPPKRSSSPTSPPSPWPPRPRSST